MGYAHGGARPRSGQPGRRWSRTSTSAPPTSTPPALDRLAERCAAITTEFENVPAAALRDAGAAPPGRAGGGGGRGLPGPRRREGGTSRRSGVACAPHARDRERGATSTAVADALLPGILKTARLGYDGKGQRRSPTAPRWPRRAPALGGVPCVLEKRLPLAAEISVIVARGARRRRRPPAGAGEPAPRRHPRRHARAGARRRRAGAAATRRSRWPTRIAAALDYVGVLCVEFFVLADGSLVANEMAPRPHNSGHYSIDACDVSQFDLQVRTLAGAPLVAPRLHSPARDAQPARRPLVARRRAPAEPDWAGVLALPGAHLHLYGKARGAAGPQDGPPDAHRGQRRRGRGACRARPRALGLRRSPRRWLSRCVLDGLDAAAIDRAAAPARRRRAGRVSDRDRLRPRRARRRRRRGRQDLRAQGPAGRPSADRPRRRPRRRRALRRRRCRRSPSA